MTTSIVPAEIADFAARVREQLRDLPAEEVDDLTEGLEADLAEAYSEDLQRELPDPVAYATELRNAAGLPAPAKGAKAGMLSGLAKGWRDTRADIGMAIRRNPALVGMLDFFNVLRPLWWIVRAWLATWLVAAFFGSEQGYGVQGGWWLVMGAFVVISVQWGRGQWHGRGVPAAIVIGNIVAVVAFIPIMAAAGSWDGAEYDTGYNDGLMADDGEADDGPSDGLAFNGAPLENIYAYDAAGKPVHGVQLFDVDGKPLVTMRNTEEQRLNPQPTTLETGAQAYNVFPLNLVWMTYNEDDELVVDPSPDPDKARAFRDGPFLKVPGLQVPEKVAKANQ